VDRLPVRPRWMRVFDSATLCQPSQPEDRPWQGATPNGAPIPLNGERRRAIADVMRIVSPPFPFDRHVMVMSTSLVQLKGATLRRHISHYRAEPAACQSFQSRVHVLPLRGTQVSSHDENQILQNSRVADARSNSDCPTRTLR
jgi:hypothetical protein